MSVPQIAQVIFYSEDTVARCIHVSRLLIDCLMRHWIAS